ncbi:MAG: glycosyltransferase family 87 protein [Anaerolineales bacterium]
MKRALIPLAAICFLAVLAFLPLPIPPYLDFQVIYHADMGLLHGIPVYDHAGQVNMIAQLAHVTPEQVFVLPFPYPPWYALITLPLAWLPITIAARIWFGLNLLMLFTSIWLLTDGWEPRKRLISFVAGLLFLPVLGSLFVGQYGFPVLLGAALFSYSLRREKVILTGLAAALLTLKPHLGMLVLLIGLVYLLLLRNDFARRSLIAILLAGVFLFVVGFLASPLWPLDYFHSLAGFKNVSQCQLCNSIPMELAGLSGSGLDRAVWFAIGLLVLALGWLIWQQRRLAQSPVLLVSAAVIVTLLASPYLQNYDYVILLAPFFVLAGGVHHFQWLWLTAAYILPWLGFGFLGAIGAVTLIYSTLLLFILLTHTLRPLDVSPPPAYNPTTTQ